MSLVLSRRSMAVAAVVLLIGLAPLLAGLSVTLEDGYYYYTVARHIAEGRGSTFDGLHPTNGYQPLWMALLVPLFAAVAGHVQAGIWIANAVQLAALAVAGVLLVQAADEIASPVVAPLVLLLWATLSHRFWLEGLEYAVYSLALALTLKVWLQPWWVASGTRANLVLGCCCALVFLARLDAGLLAACLGVAILLERRDDEVTSGLSQCMRRGVWFALPLIMVAIGYCVWSLALFGHPTPVSGAVKLDWSRTLVEQQPLYLHHGFLVEKIWSAIRPLVFSWRSVRWTVAFSMIAVAGGCLVCVLPTHRIRGREQLRRLLPWLAFAVGSYLLYSFAFHRVIASPGRYYTVQPMLAALLAGAALDQIGACWRRRLALLGSGLLAVVLTLSLVHRHRVQQGRGPHQISTQALQWAQEHAAVGTVIGTWKLGFLGYHLPDHRVINLDGLVNSWTYFLEDRHEPCAYFRREGVQYLVDVFERPRRPVIVSAEVPVALPCGGSLELLEHDGSLHPAWELRLYRVADARRSEQPTRPLRERSRDSATVDVSLR